MKSALADRMADLLVKVAAAGLLVVTAIIGWQVFGRYVLRFSPSWTEQASLLLMIWYVFLAAAAGVWERFHIRIEILEQSWTEANRRRLRIAIHALVALMGLALLVYGAMLAWDVRVHVVPSLGISRAWAYVVIPFAGLLIAFFSLARIRVRLAERAAGLMEILVLFVALFVLLALGVPVAFALFGAALATFAAADIPLIVAVQRMAAGISVFTLMAIPFFIFAGDLMYRAGIAERLVRVADAALGRVRGGLGLVDVGASMMFGAVSGSAIASASAIGSTMVPLMDEKGYDRDYSVNVTVTAAIVGLLIPPSHNMIIYAAASGIGVSIGDLFLAGIVPGLMTGGMLMMTAWLVARHRNLPRGTFPGWGAFMRAALYALPGLMTGVIIMGGILTGIFTPTESSAIAVIYTITVGTLVYRNLGWRGTWEAAQKSVRTAAMVLFIIAAATAFGFALALLEVPAALGGLIAAITANPLMTLLVINIMLLLLGTFMDMAPLIVITTPIFLPVAMASGVDPVHFGIILMINLGIGLVTPPVGSVLFVGSAVSKVPIVAMIRTIWPFYLTLIAALLLISFIPALSLWLPGRVLNRGLSPAQTWP